MYVCLAEVCIFVKFPFIKISSEQEGLAITKPMPIPTIDTSRTQVFGMSGSFVIQITDVIDCIMCTFVFFQRLPSKELPDASSPVPTSNLRVIKNSIRLTLNR